MPVTVIVGAQWGDEGKGKLTHFLAPNYSLVMRYQGGSNAGHTVISRGKSFKFNLLPSGVLYPECTCLLGDGMVIDPSRLIEEIDTLKRENLWFNNIRIGSRANLVLPYHILQDELEEARLAGKAIGTTKKGIGPAYADKYARLGILVGDLLRPEYLKERLSIVLDYKRGLFKGLYGTESLPDFSTLYSKLVSQGEILAPYVVETSSLVRGYLEAEKPILCEGAQGVLLDIDYGTYPYTTSSHSVSAGACLGTGLSPKDITRVIGVSKAYATRVGGGSFPTELKDEVGDYLRNRGLEYGTTTGRPRRCGWLDLVLLKYSVAVSGCTELCITKLDVLDGLKEIKVCVAYKREGVVVESTSLSEAEISTCEPVFESFPGWETPTNEATSYDELPQQVKAFIEFIESRVGVPVSILSVGEDTEQTILRSHPLQIGASVSPQ